MDEWIDPCEIARRKHEAACKKFIGQLTKNIRMTQMFYLAEMLLCAVNAGLGLHDLILAWVENFLWLGLFMFFCQASAAVFLGWWGLRSRRRVRTLRALRKNMVGVMKAKTPIQVEHYMAQGNTAMRNLIANR
jgi:hypothetical protein